MSLLRLLSAGRSWVGTGPDPSRYRMRTQHLLPKFGSAKNPFAKNAETTTAKVSAPATSGPAKIERPKMVTGSLFEAKAKAAAEVAKVEEAPAPARAAEQAPVRVAKTVAAPAPAVPVPMARKAPAGAGWQKALNALSWLPRGRAARPALYARPVQAELSLEKVRVVRNDLSDSDLDVAPVRLAPANNGADSRMPQVMASEPSGWSRVTSRFFGVEQVQMK